MSIQQILTKAVELNVSDIHLTKGVPPVFRLNGELKRVGSDALTSEQLAHFVKETMPEKFQTTFQEVGQVDYSYEVPEVARFRVNAFFQKGEIAFAFRLIPIYIPSIEELRLPASLKELALLPQGLVLVTGPTGSGKSTTLAAMIRYINEVRAQHIITLEDPIEYYHEHQQSIIDQREVGFDTPTFADGLRASLRQDPDVILVGEMRDLETISTAITAAETGHLVFATLHTWSAPSTIDRIIDVFPHGQQSQIRIQLAGVLQAVFSQRLFKTTDGKGRKAATELMIMNAAISNLIRSEKVYQIPNVMQTSRASGMHLMKDSVETLLTQGHIYYEDAQPYLVEEQL